MKEKDGASDHIHEKLPVNKVLYNYTCSKRVGNIYWYYGIPQIYLWGSITHTYTFWWLLTKRDYEITDCGQIKFRKKSLVQSTKAEKCPNFSSEENLAVTLFDLCFSSSSCFSFISNSYFNFFSMKFHIDLFFFLLWNYLKIFKKYELDFCKKCDLKPQETYANMPYKREMDQERPILFL